MSRARGPVIGWIVGRVGRSTYCLTHDEAKRAKRPGDRIRRVYDTGNNPLSVVLLGMMREDRVKRFPRARGKS